MSFSTEDFYFSSTQAWKRFAFIMLGGEIKPKDPLRLSIRRELTVFLTGSLSNLLAGSLFDLMDDRISVGFLLAGINLSLGFYLLPVGGFDGGRIFLCLLSEKEAIL